MMVIYISGINGILRTYAHLRRHRHIDHRVVSRLRKTLPLRSRATTVARQFTYLF